MQARWAEFEERNVGALVISFASSERLEVYEDALQLPFAVASDPERRAYAAYGMTRGSFWQIWGAQSMWAYAKLLAAGRALKKPSAGDDLSQLGGNFILGPAKEGQPRRLWFAHVSQTPADRPAVDALLVAVDGRA